MIRAFTLALGDLADPAILRLLVRSLAVTLLLFVAIGVALVFLLKGLDPCALWSWRDSCRLGFSAGGFSAALLTAILLWLLFPAVAIGVISAYADRIIAVVEARHYPAASASARPLGWMRGAVLGLRSGLRVLIYNLIALPFYILLLITGVGTPILVIAVNGIALGRDFGEMVVARHGDRASRTTWLRATRGERALMGVAVAAMFLVHFANLLAPVLGAAAMAHLFHGVRGKGSQAG